MLYDYPLEEILFFMNFTVKISLLQLNLTIQRHFVSGTLHRSDQLIIKIELSLAWYFVITTILLNGGPPLLDQRGTASQIATLLFYCTLSFWTVPPTIIYDKTIELMWVQAFLRRKVSIEMRSVLIDGRFCVRSTLPSQTEYSNRIENATVN